MRQATTRLGFHPVTAVVPLLSLTACAVILAFSPIQQGQNGDSLVPVFISLEHWRPFYWEQTRFGSLIPLLAMPVSDYRWNVLFQTFLIVLAAFAGLVALAASLAPSRDARSPGRILAITGLAAALVALCCRADGAIAASLLPQAPYFPSFGLLLPGIVLLRGVGRRATRLAAWLLIVLAFWVDISQVVLAMLAVALLPSGPGPQSQPHAHGDHPFPLRPLGRRWIYVGFVLLAGVLNAGFARLFGPPQEYRLLSPYVAFFNFREMIEESVARVVDLPVIVALVIAFLLAASWQRRATLNSRSFLPRHALVFAAVAILYAVFISSLWWVQFNNSPGRYWTIPWFLLLGTMAACVAATAHDALVRLAGLSGPCAACACALVSLSVFLLLCGAPGVSKAMAHLALANRAKSAATAEIIQTNCNVLTGNYWDVWPTLFDLRTQGRFSIYPITPRSIHYREQILRIPPASRVYCGFCDDPEALRWPAFYRIATLHESRRLARTCLYSPQP